MDKQLVLFGLGTQNFGADVASVVRVGLIPEIINKPKSPHFIEGQSYLCGCNMPVVDLHRWFGMRALERNEDSCIMVANINGMHVGMIVSAVTDVISIDENTIEPPAKMANKNNSDYIFGMANVNEHLVTLVDFEQILSTNQKDQLKLYAISSD